MLQRVEDRGCAYLPQVNAFYMHDFQMLHASEEAARFLHHACRGLPARVTAREEAADEPSDFFYGRVLENALAYFGSRVFYPGAARLARGRFARIERADPRGYRAADRTRLCGVHARARFSLLHRLLEVDAKQCDQVRGSLDEGIRSSGAQVRIHSQQLGYLLGCDLYDAYLEGRATPGFVRGSF